MSLTAEQEARIAAVIRDEIKPMFDAYIAESLRDHDLASQSVEFRRGWETGMREGLVSALQMLQGARRRT